jgi:thioredoxin reductase (NADPH)
MVVPLEVTGACVEAGYKRLALSDGRQLVTRTLLVATGMEYREHPAPGVLELTGAGVYYGAAVAEAPSFKDRRVLVVGGGNSAGQAALYLARYAAEIQIVIRRDSLRESMSHYLVEQIEKTPNIRLRTRTELGRVAGADHVEQVTLNVDGGNSAVEELAAVFIFIGTKPRTDWLADTVLRDDKGFVITGRDLTADARYVRVWKERREPMALESSAPGVFAAGDARAGALNRVASAVGEGSMVVRLVHDYLALT